jgi:predicted PurR-regulated permease PerM
MDFLHFLWSLLLIFFMICYFMVLFSVIMDVFRNDKIGGFMKAVWLVLLIFIPLLALLVYVIMYNDDMQQRAMDRAKANMQAQQAYIQTMAGTSSAADQIATANTLLASGAITQAEYDTIKKQALASA